MGIGPNNSYNDNKIRFPAPVPVDSKVRGKAEVVSVDDVGDSVTRVMAPAADGLPGSVRKDAVLRRVGQ